MNFLSQLPRSSCSLRALAAISVALSLGVVTGCSYQALDLSRRACPCISGWVCDTTQNICIEATSGCTGGSCCVDDTGCTDPLPRCALDSHSCVACLPDSDNCVAGQYCLDSRQCAPGCKTNTDCTSASAPLCDHTRRECVQCVQSTDCTSGMFCSPSGTCVLGCDPSTPCAGGGSCCAGLCIDTTSDYLNCKGCGISCGATASCCAGTCTNLPGDVANCGQCGLACTTTMHGAPTCTTGSCSWACETGWAHCSTGNTGCETTISNNLNHCGSCSNDCSLSVRHTTGPVCSNNHCNYSACAAGYLDCDDSRSNGCETDPTATTSHCGSCATSCYTQIQNASGTKCSSSACDYTTCKTGYGDCDGVRTNGCECACGAIGKICCPGMLCGVSGTCGVDGMCH